MKSIPAKIGAFQPYLKTLVLLPRSLDCLGKILTISRDASRFGNWQAQIACVTSSHQQNTGLNAPFNRVINVQATCCSIHAKEVTRHFCYRGVDLKSV